MAEIFRPKFGQPRGEQTDSLHETDASSIIESTPDEDRAAEADVEFLRSHMDVWEATQKRESEALDFIEALQDFVPNEQDVELRRAGLKGNSLQQICEMWLSSGETEWKNKPSFYMALIFEREMRRIGVQEALKRLPPDE